MSVNSKSKHRALGHLHQQAEKKRRTNKGDWGGVTSRVGGKSEENGSLEEQWKMCFKKQITRKGWQVIGR